MIVLALVGNNYEMFEYEEVREEEEISLARKINAINQRVSSNYNFGIEELFQNIGKKLFDTFPENIVKKKINKRNI